MAVAMRVLADKVADTAEVPAVARALVASSRDDQFSSWGWQCKSFVLPTPLFYNTSIMTNFKEYDLVSGNKCFFVDIESPISAVSIWINKGSRNDPKGKEGLAHFFEHIFMTQTKKFPTRQKKLQALESLGIYFNAFTSKEKTFFFHIQPKEKTEESLDLLIDGFVNSKISEKVLEKEKNIILEEESRNRQNISDYFWRLRDRALWPNSSLGKDLFGNSKTIKSITKKDVIGFQQKYYVSPNINFIIIGQVDREKIIEKINKYFEFSKIKLNAEEAEIIGKEPNFLIFEKRNIPNANIGLYYKTTSVQNSKEMIALDLIREIIGGTWISRLNQSLRIKNNLTYWVSGISQNFSDTGFIGAEFSCSLKNIKKAFPLALKEIDSIVNKVTNVDIKAYISSLVSSVLRNNCTAEQLLWWYGQMAITNKINLSPEDYVKELETITANEVISVAKKFLKKENRAIVVIGPKSIEKSVIDIVKKY